MELLEIYKEKYEGNKFKVVGLDQIFYFGSIEDRILKIYCGEGHTLQSSNYYLSDAFQYIESGEWVLDKNYLRKKKIEKLIK